MLYMSVQTNYLTKLIFTFIVLLTSISGLAQDSYIKFISADAELSYLNYKITDNNNSNKQNINESLSGYISPSVSFNISFYSNKKLDLFLGIRYLNSKMVHTISGLVVNIDQLNSASAEIVSNITNNHVGGQIGVNLKLDENILLQSQLGVLKAFNETTKSSLNVITGQNSIIDNPNFVISDANIYINLSVLYTLHQTNNIRLDLGPHFASLLIPHKLHFTNSKAYYYGFGLKTYIYILN